MSRLRTFSVVLVWVAALLSTAGAQRPLSFSHFVLFGDSLTDAGETYNAQNDYCQQIFPINNPNGVCNQYPGPAYGYSTAVFTDGEDSSPGAQQFFFTWHQELYDLLLGEIAPPYLQANEFNYAWGFAQTTDGTFTDNNGATPVTAENMGAQVTDYLNGPNPVNAGYLYVLFGGMQDLLYDSSAANAGAAAQRLTSQVARLANAGATTFLVPNLPPLTAYSAASSYNAAAATFNTALSADLATLAAQYSAQGTTLRIVNLDLNTLFTNIAANPSAYGFTDVTQPAQTASGSVDPDTYLSWDGINPTTAGHYQIAYAACSALTGTRTTLASSAATSSASSPATLTATVSTGGTYAPPMPGTPTGSVAFYVQGQLIATAPVQPNGTATLSGLSLPAGTDSVTALYSGDTNFPRGCPPRPVTVNVTAGSGTYSLVFSPAQLSIAVGQGQQTFVSATSANGDHDFLNISCGTLPANFSCLVYQSPIGIGTSSQAEFQVYAYVAYAERTAPPRFGGQGHGIALALAAPFGLLAWAFRRRHLRMPLLAVLLAALTLGVTACSGGANTAGPGSGSGGGGGGSKISYPAAGTYSIPVVATDTVTGASTTTDLTVVVH